MRLIDADVLAESSCYRVCQECDDMYKGKNITTNCSEIRLRFLRLINDAPTVDPVKHGQWIMNYDIKPIGTFCSECGWAWSNNIDAVKVEPSLSKIKTMFCPNCGAKMDE